MKLLHPEKTEEELQHFALVQVSGKLVLIEKLLPKLRRDGHKVCVVCSLFSFCCALCFCFCCAFLRAQFAGANLLADGESARPHRGVPLKYEVGIQRIYRLIYCSYTYERIDGNVKGNERQAAIDRFSKPGESMIHDPGQTRPAILQMKTL